MRDVYQIRKIPIQTIKKPGFYPDFNNIEKYEEAPLGVWGF